MRITRLLLCLLLFGSIAILDLAFAQGSGSIPRPGRAAADHRTRTLGTPAGYVCDASACDDGDPCTLDLCDRICVDARCTRFEEICLADHPVVDDGTTCDDGDSNTVDDVCTAGVCEGRLASCPCWDGDLRVPDDLGVLRGLSLISDPEPLCDLEPPPTDEWTSMCTESLTLNEYIHPEICGDLDIYGSLIRLAYLASDSSGGRRCEASIMDAGYYTMFNLRSLVEGISEQELADCQALQRQVFECPTGR